MEQSSLAFKSFVIDVTLTRKDALIASTILFYRSLGYALLVLVLSVFVLWALAFFEYKLTFTIIILLLLYPWLRFLIRLAIGFYKIPKTRSKKIEFTNDYIKLSVKGESINICLEILRNTIKSIIYTKNYRLILSKQNCHVLINRKTLTDEEMTKITKYLGETEPLRWSLLSKPVPFLREFKVKQTL